MPDAVWLAEADVVATVDLLDAIDAVEEALRSEARGDARTMEKAHVAWGGGHTLHAIGGIDEHEGIVATKTWAHTEGGATPLVVHAAEGDELIASGAESVIAYDPATGKELWRSDGTRSHPIPSPVATKGIVFLTAGSQAKVVMAMRPGGTGDPPPNTTPEPASFVLAAFGLPLFVLVRRRMKKAQA